MKKAILAFAVVTVSFAACNGSDKKTDETKTSDTTQVVKKDTATVVKDTVVKTTTSIDTLKKK
jgi:hypothetical protein